MFPIVYISDWSFKEATLIKQLGGGTEVQAGNEGLLYVTLVNELTGAEESGTVCAEKGTFSRQAGRLMCQSMGFVVGEGFYSGIFPNYKYVTELVCNLLNLHSFVFQILCVFFMGLFIF